MGKYFLFVLRAGAVVLACYACYDLRSQQPGATMFNKLLFVFVLLYLLLMTVLRKIMK